MYFAQAAIMQTPNACTLDVTAPTFAGIATLVAQANGSLKATWLAATETGSPPARYRVFIQKNSATGLFSSGNQLLDTYELSQDIYTLKDGTSLELGATYFVGVRALDQTGNIDGNTVSLSAVSKGVLSGDILTVAQTLNALLVGLEGGVQGVVENGDGVSGVVSDEGPVSGVVDCKN